MSEEKQQAPEVIDPRGWPDRKIQKEFECYGVSFEDDRELGDDSVCMATCLVRDRCIKIIATKIPAIEIQGVGKSAYEGGKRLDDGRVMEALGAETEETIQLGRKLLPMMEVNKGGHPTGKWKKGLDNPIEQFLPPQALPSQELLAAINAARQGKPPPEPGEYPATKPAEGGGLSLVLGGASAEEAEEESTEAPEEEASADIELPDDTVVVGGDGADDEGEEGAGPLKKKAAKKKAPAKKKAKAKAKKTTKKKAAAKKKAPAKKKAAAKKTTKKAPAKKKAAPKKAAKKATAKKAAKKTAKKAAPKKAAPKKAKAKKSKPKKSGETMTRFERERARSPKVAALKAGQKLTREYDGKTYTVEVKKDHYVLKGLKGGAQKHETLYATVVAIAGTKDYDRQGGGSGTRAMSNWSSPKFWKL